MRRSLAVLSMTIPLIAVVVLTAAGAVLAGGGCHGELARDAVPSEASESVVKLDGCTYAPTITRVPIGTEVRFVNDSNTYHDVTGRDGAWASGQLVQGAAFSHRFVDAGLYPYSCSLHPGMAGVVVVGSPLAAAAAPLEPDAAPAAAVSGTPTAETTPLLPIAAAGGLGLLAGALATAIVVTRRSNRVA